MKINNREYIASALDVLYDLRAELQSNNIDLISDIKDGPDNIIITCPYHSNGHERRPSMGVKKDNGICHCFTCDTVVDLTELISYCLSSNGKNWLADRYDTIEYQQVKSVADDLVKANSREQDKIILAKARGEYKEDTSKFVSEEELDSYRYTHPYWAKRGIVEDWVIELFDLGYDREKQMITFPVRDELGRCEFVAKRSVKTKFFQYPSGVSKPLYGLYEINKKYPPFLTDVYGEKPRSHPTEIFVCESMIDCILLWQSGHYAVALNGLGNERQFKQLRELPCRHLILATDNDEAGEKARQRIRSKVDNKILTEIKFPKDIKDIGECTREQIDNIKDWEKWGFER